MTLKKLPNLVTGLRLLLAAVLLFLPVPGTAFTALYLFCGLTDIADGWLARRLQAQSTFGAKLDSAADFCFVLVMLCKLLPLFDLPLWCLLWVAAIFLLRLAAAFAAKVRFGQFTFLHTAANKLTGLLLFLYPLWLLFGCPIWGICILCSAAALSALEELMIQLTAKSLKADRASIFFKE